MCINKRVYSLPHIVQTATKHHPQLDSSITHAVAVMAAVSIFFLAGPAFSADESWVQPGVNIVDALKSGGVTIGALVAGLGVMVVGIWACATLRMEWSKLGYVMIGGVLVMAGPQMVAGLLDLAKQ